MTRGRGRFSPVELKEFRARLIKRRQADIHIIDLLKEVAAGPRSRGEITSVPLHLADQGTDTFDQDRDLGLAERESREVAQIEQAIQRIEQGTFGICENCGKPISRERLRVIPWGALCVVCQTRQEAA